MSAVSSKLSVHREFFPTLPTFDPIGLPSRDREGYLQMLFIAKLIASVVKQGAKALLHSEYSQFDPIILDNSCQIRGLHIIIYGEALKEEAAHLKRISDAALDRIQREMSRPHVPGVRITLEDLMGLLTVSVELIQTYVNNRRASALSYDL